LLARGLIFIFKPVETKFVFFFFFVAAVDPKEEILKRIRRQEDSKKEESFEVELCKDKDAGEWFRLVAGDGDNCRDVIQCTSSVR